MSSNDDDDEERPYDPDAPQNNKPRKAILEILGGASFDETLPHSTSEITTVCMRLRWEALPEPYGKLDDAWDRLNDAQRAVVAEFNPTFRADEWMKRKVYYA